MASASVSDCLCPVLPCLRGGGAGTPSASQLELPDGARCPRVFACDSPGLRPSKLISHSATNLPEMQGAAHPTPVRAPSRKGHIRHAARQPAPAGAVQWSLHLTEPGLLQGQRRQSRPGATSQGSGAGGTGPPGASAPTPTEGAGQAAPESPRLPAPVPGFGRPRLGAGARSQSLALVRLLPSAPCRGSSGEKKPVPGPGWPRLRVLPLALPVGSCHDSPGPAIGEAAASPGRGGPSCPPPPIRLRGGAGDRGISASAARGQPGPGGPPEALTPCSGGVCSTVHPPWRRLPAPVLAGSCRRPWGANPPGPAPCAQHPFPLELLLPRHSTGDRAGDGVARAWPCAPKEEQHSSAHPGSLQSPAPCLRSPAFSEQGPDKALWVAEQSSTAPAPRAGQGLGVGRQRWGNGGAG